MVSASQLQMIRPFQAFALSEISGVPVQVGFT